MNTNLYNRNNSNSFRLKTENNNSILKLSGDNVLGNALNIKKYFNSPYKTIENIEIASKIDNNQLLTISNENLSSYRKLPFHMKNKSNNISSENNYKSDKNILFKLINNKNSEPNKTNISKLYLKTDNNVENLDLKNTNNKREKFVFLHEIKKIKKKVDLSHRDKSIKNIMDNQIPFEEKNSKLALNPIKLINNFQDFKKSELINNSNMFSFLTEKAKISRKNVLIKLLLEQKNNYNKTTIEHQKMLTEMKKNIDIDENNFQTLIRNQKISSKKIEELLEQLLQRKRNLLIEQFRLSSEIRTRLDERTKLLERIDEYRIIAKFVTKALGGNGKLFEFNLTRYENRNNDTDNDYISEKEAQRVLQRFRFLLNYEPDVCYINQDDIDIFKEVTSLNYSDLLFHQLWKKEDFILNNLRKNEILNKEIVYLEENEEKKLAYLKNKIELLEKELIYNKEVYKAEKEEYEKTSKKLIDNNSEFEDLIEDLYIYYFKDKKNQNKKGKKSISSSLDTKTYITSLQKAMIEIEDTLNELSSKLDKYANEDRILYDKVVSNARTENKQIHVSNMKKIMDIGEQNKLKLLKIPKEKIIIKYKKSAPPYYLMKKEKKVKVDPVLVEQLENEELLTYE